MLSTQPMVTQLRQKLQNFSDADYLLATGDPSAIAVAASIAAEFNRGQYKLLKWNEAVQIIKKMPGKIKCL